jgi:hypothetical protein
LIDGQIADFVEALPQTVAADVLGRQFVRAGFRTAGNY